MKHTRITLSRRIKSGILALGTQSKSAFCFAKGNFAYLSDPAGDLGDLKNFKRFEQGVRRFQKKLKIKPDIIACDLHPEYITTKYANDLVKGISRLRSGQEGLRVKSVQHHEAHVASCIVDNDIKGRIIGVAFDGTGFGLDGNIWGGEFFIGDIKGFKRAAHLKYVPMPGGEACIREPWRMALSYLYNIYGNKNLFCRSHRNDMLRQMIDKKINAPLTSSVGRLFDGVSALIGVCGIARYEGEAAIKLEKIIKRQGTRDKGQGKYKFKYIDDKQCIIIDWEPVIKDIVKDLKSSVRKSEISLKFHNAICSMIKETCKLLRKRYKINKVCMSGGVFQNRYLTNALRPLLEKAGFEVYLHKNVPTHDGGIALGQAALAYQRLHF